MSEYVTEIGLWEYREPSIGSHSDRSTVTTLTMVQEDSDEVLRRLIGNCKIKSFEGIEDPFGYVIYKGITINSKSVKGILKDIVDLKVSDFPKLDEKIGLIEKEKVAYENKSIPGIINTLKSDSTPGSPYSKALTVFQDHINGTTNNEALSFLDALGEDAFPWAADKLNDILERKIFDYTDVSSVSINIAARIQYKFDKIIEEYISNHESKFSLSVTIKSSGKYKVWIKYGGFDIVPMGLQPKHISVKNLLIFAQACANQKTPFPKFTEINSENFIEHC